MSLFPAYSATLPESATQHENQEQAEKVWLENSSFKANLECLYQPSSSKQNVADSGKDSDSNEKEAVPRKKKKKHKKTSRRKEEDVARVEVKTPESEHFKIDTQRSYGTYPAAPKYKIGGRLKSNLNSTRRKRKFKRYYKCLLTNDGDKSNSEPESVITKRNLASASKPEKDENFAGFKQEQGMSETTSYYNRKLAGSPHDVEMWLKYVRFQDDVFKFEKTYRKGSIAKGQRVTAERKLAILDRALQLNPNCDDLVRERLNIIVSVYPSDELQAQTRKLIEKEQGNIILWQGYIEATQCSMSHCNTPAVLKLYAKCLSTLHQIRRQSALEKSLLEENILHMLYQCGLFLKQSGLFEQLWTLLRMYLDLNLAPTDKRKFHIGSGFDEKQLVELEEVVLGSQLPIHELWLRIERLREACHWFPYLGTGECEDPQRLVFPEDVAELIHPITMPGNTFILTATIMTLVKIPLLPCRHTTMQELGLNYVPWSLDSIESLLPIFFPLYPLDMENHNLLKDTHMLAVGPQYLKTLPGQEEYLDFLLALLKNCIDCLENRDKLAVTVWWFRFQRLLVVLDKQKRFKMSASFKKKMRSAMKSVLKESGNNAVFYAEFALVECELGNVDAAVNVLVTAMSVIAGGKSVVTLGDYEERGSICLLYRTLVELQLGRGDDDGKQSALKYLVALASGKDATPDVLTQGATNEASLTFKHVTLQLLTKNLEPLTCADHFLPDFATDWIALNAWFLYLNKGPIDCGTFLEDTLTKLDDLGMEKSWRREVLFEFYVAVLFRHCQLRPESGIFKLLDDALHRAIGEFPNNLFLLAVLAKEQSMNCCLGQSWWRITGLLMKTCHALPTLFVILIANQRMADIEDKWVDTITGTNFINGTSYTNKIMSLFRRLLFENLCTRRCGLAWRLYLQFLHANYDPTVCRRAYYTAVEECPWLKALYIDAAIYIPAELPQIQDLIIEKQLRIHVTPEELDVLRN